LPKSVKYVLINHTFHQLDKLSHFQNCDCYVSVCNFLESFSRISNVHESRKVVILNGLENDYLDDINTLELDGDFVTGRCHRMVSGKFRMDSIPWLARLSNYGFSHYILGFHKELKNVNSKYKNIHYIGSVEDRIKKMSYIKSFDTY